MSHSFIRLTGQQHYLLTGNYGPREAPVQQNIVSLQKRTVTTRLCGIAGAVITGVGGALSLCVDKVRQLDPTGGWIIGGVTVAVAAGFLYWQGRAVTRVHGEILQKREELQKMREELVYKDGDEILGILSHLPRQDQIAFIKSLNKDQIGDLVKAAVRANQALIVALSLSNPHFSKEDFLLQLKQLSKMQQLEVLSHMTEKDIRELLHLALHSPEKTDISTLQVLASKLSCDVVLTELEQSYASASAIYPSLLKGMDNNAMLAALIKKITKESPLTAGEISLIRALASIVETNSWALLKALSQDCDRALIREIVKGLKKEKEWGVFVKGVTEEQCQILARHPYSVGGLFSKIPGKKAIEMNDAGVSRLLSLMGYENGKKFLSMHSQAMILELASPDRLSTWSVDQRRAILESLDQNSLQLLLQPETLREYSLAMKKEILSRFTDQEIWDIVQNGRGEMDEESLRAILEVLQARRGDFQQLILQLLEMAHKSYHTYRRLPVYATLLRYFPKELANAIKVHPSSCAGSCHLNFLRLVLDKMVKERGERLTCFSETMGIQPPKKNAKSQERFWDNLNNKIPSVSRVATIASTRFTFAALERSKVKALRA